MLKIVAVIAMVALLGSILAYTFAVIVEDDPTHFYE